MRDLQKNSAQEEGCFIGAGSEMTPASNEQLLQWMDPDLGEYAMACEEIKIRLDDYRRVVRELHAAREVLAAYDEKVDGILDALQTARSRMAYFTLEESTQVEAALASRS